MSFVCLHYKLFYFLEIDVKHVDFPTIIARKKVCIISSLIDDTFEALFMTKNIFYFYFYFIE